MPGAGFHIIGFHVVKLFSAARPVSKATWCLTNPADVAGVMREAFRTARSDRPGPVMVDLPLNAQMADVSYRFDENRPLPWSKPVPAPDAIGRLR